MRPLKKAVSRLLFGESLPQEFTVGMRSPQDEIDVWLCGRQRRREITNQHSTACSDPFVLCIRLQDGEATNANELWLEYVERKGEKRVLGKIELKAAAGIELVGNGLHFFEVRSTRNWCLPRLQTAAHYLLQAYNARIRPKTPDINMTLLEERAAIVTFIRPHPIGIGSVEDMTGGNIFIMNLMGELGEGRFGFGLKDSRWPAHLVERTGRLALSSVPVEEGKAAFSLAATHMVERVDWEKLPFALQHSTQFKIRVPEFASRIRELEVESVRRIGSHTFFVTRVIRDEQLAEREELYALHGFYQAWRLRGRNEALQLALAQDADNKRGLKSNLSTHSAMPAQDPLRPLAQPESRTQLRPLPAATPSPRDT
jgi:hypothetical protein